MNMLYWEWEYFSKDVVKVSATEWLWSWFYQGCADLHTPGQEWVWNSPVQIGLKYHQITLQILECFRKSLSAQFPFNLMKPCILGRSMFTKIRLVLFKKNFYEKPIMLLGTVNYFFTKILVKTGFHEISCFIWNLLKYIL